VPRLTLIPKEPIAGAEAGLHGHPAEAAASDNAEAKYSMYSDMLVSSPKRLSRIDKCQDCSSTTSKHYENEQDDHRYPY